MNISIKKNKKNEQLFTIHMENVTEGQFLALKHALEDHLTPVGWDVYNDLRQAVTAVQDEIPLLGKYLKEFSEE